MAKWTATVIIEPRFLVREALHSLIKNYPYRVVCAVASTADIASPSIVGDGPKLVILGAQSADKAVAEALGIRKLWSHSKIVLLFEYASVTDFQKLLTSEIDGCVPLFVSPAALIRTLDMIMIEDACVMVTAGKRRPSIQPAQTEDPYLPEVEIDELPSGSTELEAIPTTIVAMQRTRRTVNGSSASHLNGHNGDTQCVPAPRNRPGLSEREAQILGGLVQGHANKVIARSCDITEATVKVHMKSILRKIRVANRTQAAVWALEHGHSADEIEAPPANSGLLKRWNDHQNPVTSCVSRAAATAETKAESQPSMIGNDRDSEQIQ
jgi:two-component system nitrate/nitrite response regulator NarL